MAHRILTPRRIAAMLVPLALVSAALIAAPAQAAAPLGYGATPPAASDPNPAGPDTEATIVEMRDTSGLYGGTVPSATATTPYPRSGLQNQRSVTTAQIVLEDPQAPGDEIVTYCIDLDTQTTVGTHYELGTWTEANVPNLPYVQWILDNYYPQVPAQPVAGSDAEKVRAVQGAIWYFTDKFVVNRFYPAERNAVRAIVEAAQAALAAPVDPDAPVGEEPPHPTLTINPPTGSAAPGQITGPYAVTRYGVENAPISIREGTEVFTDAAGTEPVADGTDVVNGDRFWVSFSGDAADPGFTILGDAEIAAGNVYLYDGNNPPRTTAQKLVLAARTVVPVRAALDITRAPGGTLRVDVSVDGDAAGLQGQIALEVACTADRWSLTQPAYRVANAPEGTATVATIDGIPAGATCDVTQTNDGDNAFADLTSTTAPLLDIPVEPGEPVVATVANVYAAPAPPTGALEVSVAITGPAAGEQSAAQVIASCVAGGDVLTRVIPVAAGFAGTTVVADIEDVPDGAECAVVQTVDGRNADAAFDADASSIEPDAVTITAGETSEILVTNVYLVPVPATGTLEVDVTIDGDAAGEQGEIELIATCELDGEEIAIPISVAAGATGTTTAASIDDIEADAICSVTQTDDGANARASLSASTIEPASVEIRDGEVATVEVANAYAAVAPSPTPTVTPTPGPTQTALPATGSSGPGPWGLGLAALLLGAAALAADTLRRRFRKA